MKEVKVKCYEVEVKAIVQMDLPKRDTKEDVEKAMASISSRLMKLKVTVK